MFYPDYARADDPGVLRTGRGSADLIPRGPDRHRDHRSRAQGRRPRRACSARTRSCRSEHQQGAQALSKLDFLVVRDIFLTETAEFADVILPASSYLEKDGTYTNTKPPRALGHGAGHPAGRVTESWDIHNRISLWHSTRSRDTEEMVGHPQL
jgi:formate dehydrogenase major subunit